MQAANHQRADRLRAFIASKGGRPEDAAELLAFFEGSPVDPLAAVTAYCARLAQPQAAPQPTDARDQAAHAEPLFSPAWEQAVVRELSSAPPSPAVLVFIGL